MRLPKNTVPVVAIVFCGWFLMKFHMDIANDSETQAYVNSLLSSANHLTLATDATGQYTALAPFVMWPFAANLELITGAYLIRALAFCLFTLSTLYVGLAYLWWRSLHLGPLTSLIGLVLLSTSAAFALEIRGWEIDKLLEPILFLAAALAISRRRHALFVILTIVAAANAVTGVFAPFVGLLAPRGRASRAATLIALVLCAIEVTALQRLVPPTHIRLFADANVDQLIDILGGLCLLPVLSMAAGRDAPAGLRWLLYVVVPVWVLFVLATHRLDQGAAFLAPLALVWVPVTLLQLEQLVHASVAPLTAREPEARLA